MSITATKIVTIFATIVFLSSARFTLGINENDYLLVCQAGSKKAETKVQEILATTTDHMETLEEAIDRDDVDALLQVVNEAKKAFSEKISAIQGVTYAAIQDAVGGGFVGEKKRCLQRVNGELEMLFEQVKEVGIVTKRAANEFKQDTGNEVFYQYFQDLNGLMVQVEQFLKDATQTQRLNRSCSTSDVEQLMTNVVKTLKTLRPKLINADESTKKYAIESATGVLIEAVTLNAVCHAGQYVNESDSVQQQVMRQDSKNAQNLANDLVSIAKSILGRSSWLVRIRGF